MSSGAKEMLDAIMDRIGEPEMLKEVGVAKLLINGTIQGFTVDGKLRLTKYELEVVKAIAMAVYMGALSRGLTHDG